MSNKLTITLSEAAQRGALIAGEPAKAAQTYEVPQELVSRLLALPLAVVSNEGDAECVVPGQIYYSESELNAKSGTPVYLKSASRYGSVSIAAETRPRDAAEAIACAERAFALVQEKIESKRAERAAQKAQDERESRDRAEKWAALPLAWRASVDGVCLCSPASSRGELYEGPLAMSGYQIAYESEIKSYAPEALAEASREVGRLRAARNAEIEAREKANRETLRSLIASHGTTPDQLERFDAGRLPQAERDELVESVIFKAFSGLAEFEEISEQEVAAECECDPDRVRFASTSYDGPFDAEQWATYRKITEVAPEGATVEIREHVGYERGHDDADDPDIRRLGVRVTLTFTGEEWTKEYALGA